MKFPNLTSLAFLTALAIGANAFIAHPSRANELQDSSESVSVSKKKLLRCLRRLAHGPDIQPGFHQFLTALEILENGGSTRMALDSCREGKISDTVRSLETPSPRLPPFLKMRNQKSLYHCRGVAINAGAALMIGFSGHVLGVQCSTMDFRTALIVSAGAGFGGGIGAGATVQKLDPYFGETELYDLFGGQPLPPIVVGLFNQATSGYGIMTADDVFENLYEENSSKDTSLRNVLQHPRGVGFGAYSTWGVNAGLRLFKFTREDDIRAFEQRFQVHL